MFDQAEVFLYVSHLIQTFSLAGRHIPTTKFNYNGTKLRPQNGRVLLAVWKGAKKISFVPKNPQ